MLSLLAMNDLKATIEEMGADNPDTHLKIELNGRDPDEAMTDIAYEKGAFFLQMIEETVGREKWDAFLKKYFDNFAFRTMSSERFVEYINSELIGNDTALAKELSINDWIYGPGLPDNCPVVKSDRFDKVDMAVKDWINKVPASKFSTDEWTTHEWLHFLRQLPKKMSLDQMKELDEAYAFTKSGNSEILAVWLVHSIRNKYEKAYDELEHFLITVGRRKFLRPIYMEMAKTEEGKEMALKIYKRSRQNYHSVSTGTIDGILGWDESRNTKFIE